MSIHGPGRPQGGGWEMKHMQRRDSAGLTRVVFQSHDAGRVGKTRVLSSEKPPP